EGWHGTWNLENITLDNNGALDARKERFAVDRESGVRSVTRGIAVGGAGALSGGDKSAAFANGLSINGPAAFYQNRDIAKAEFKTATEKGAQLIEPELRVNFADTALWFP